MILCATMACRNEDWILGFSLRAALQWNDHVILLLHSCTDKSSEIAEEVMREHNYKGRVHILIETSDVWEEMRHRQRMLEEARRFGATHISVVDADEVLTANLIPTIRDLIAQVQHDYIFQLPWVCLARGVDRYYSAGTWYNNWVSTAFLDAPEIHWKKQGASGYDFHHRHPMGQLQNPFRPVSQALSAHGGGLMHFQFVNERRLRAKQAKYIVDELIRWPGRMPVPELNRMYGQAVYASDTAKIPAAETNLGWFPFGYKELMAKYYHPDAEPWQEKAVREAVAQHGREKFAGADLFGVVRLSSDSFGLGRICSGSHETSAGDHGVLLGARHSSLDIQAYS